MAGVGFPQGEDVISGGINQSTPSQSSPAIREREKGRERKKVRRRPMKEESELRYETKENLAKPPSPPYSVFTLDWLSLLPLFLLPSPLSLYLSSSPSLHHRKIQRRRAAPRRGSQMNRFNEKMASRRGWEGKGRAARGESKRKVRRRRKRVALVRSSETTA